MRVALAQINTTIGDFEGNLRAIHQAVARARAERADVVVLPELAVCGYPPGDLLERPSFLRDQTRALEELVPASREVAILTGAVLPAPQGAPKRLANAAVLLDKGEIAHVQAKTLLPTYDVFDESRYFQPATDRRVIDFRGTRVGIAICEDVWSGKFWGARRPYPVDPVEELVAAGAQVIWTISASPWNQQKMALREAMLRDAARQHHVPIVFVNLVGGDDELIFDGTSFVVDRDARVVTRLARFAEDFAVIDPFVTGRPEVAPLEPDTDLLERALVLGIRDYLGKLNLGGAVIGLSGGIDSAVTADLAVRAIGPANVAGLLMPGPFSSEHSISDAEALARNLGIEARTVRIDSIYKDYLEQFRGMFGPRESYGLTQENVQARIRGALLMAVSNAENRIVLATGNKSELSMGYTTLYGDLVGGLAVLGDVLKRDVYALARHANRDGIRIPRGSIEKPPSAELAPNQKDSDSLPAYPVLDEVLHQAIELGMPGDEIEPPPGATRETVAWILKQIDRNEYKRRQAPVVLKVSEKAYGSGRRIPIVHRSGWGI
jgi:NAD+ synthase (glutamine-hydrolysing)